MVKLGNFGYEYPEKEDDIYFSRKEFCFCFVVYIQINKLRVTHIITSTALDIPLLDTILYLHTRPTVTINADNLEKTPHMLKIDKICKIQLSI